MTRSRVLAYQRDTGGLDRLQIAAARAIAACLVEIGTAVESRPDRSESRGLAPSFRARVAPATSFLLQKHAHGGRAGRDVNDGTVGSNSDGRRTGKLPGIHARARRVADFQSDGRA
jgi:hypothetical protein